MGICRRPAHQAYFERTGYHRYNGIPIGNRHHSPPTSLRPANAGGVPEYPAEAVAWGDFEMNASNPKYRMVNFRDVPGVECPCGIAHRAFGDTRSSRRRSTPRKSSSTHGFTIISGSPRLITFSNVNREPGCSLTMSYYRWNRVLHRHSAGCPPSGDRTHESSNICSAEV